MKYPTISAVLLAALAAARPVSGAAPADCGVSLKSLSRTSGAPGDEFELRGEWGDKQGAKTACFDLACDNPLEVLSWRRDVLKVRIPPGVPRGRYRVGVYCDRAGGTWHSSGWMEFEVFRAAAKTRADKDKPAAEPVGRKMDEFRARWRDKGRKLAAKPWFAAREVLVMTDAGVRPAVAKEAIATLKDQLAALGSTKLRVASGAGALPPGLAACSNDDVLDEKCFRREMTGLRRTSEKHAGRMLAVLTNSAIRLKPHKLPDGATAGPPAGIGSYEDGWILLSEFWHYWQRGVKPGVEIKHERDSQEGFETHGRDDTVRHELLHMLGLHHHELTENPGFPEVKLCTECDHIGPGHGPDGHLECCMTCGAGDDDWFHVESFGKGFGFCEKCLSAARYVVEGIEEKTK